MMWTVTIIGAAIMILNYWSYPRNGTQEQFNNAILGELIGLAIIVMATGEI